MARLLAALYTLTLIITLVGIASAQAPKDIVVAVLDSPLDYLHEDLSPHVDVETLKKLEFEIESGHKVNWHDLNQISRKKFESVLDRENLEDQIRLLGALNELQSGAFAKKMEALPEGDARLEEYKRLALSFARYLASPEYRHEVETLGTYLHGTHVSGIIVGSIERDLPSSVKLLNFPLIDEPPGGKSLDQILAFDPEKTRREVRRLFDHFTEVFKATGVRVVNGSIGTSPRSNFDRYAKIGGLKAQTFYRLKLQKIAKAEYEIFATEFRRLVEGNPEIIFVIAAGNSHTDLGEVKDDLATIGAPNVVNVSATDANGKMAEFSSFSREEIEIAAPGVGVESSLSGGGKIAMSGTSMAAPIVTRRLVRILRSNPELRANQVIELLLKEHSVSLPTLAKEVRDGKYLLPWNLVVPDRMQDGAYIKMLELAALANVNYVCERELFELTSPKDRSGPPPLEVGVATGSELKLNAVKSAFQEAFPGREIHITPFKAKSGIAEQPVMESWGITGAKNRLNNAIEIAEAVSAERPLQFDYWVSMENYIAPSQIHPDLWIDRAAIVVQTGSSHAPVVQLSDSVLLPSSYAEEARRQGAATGAPEDASGFAVTSGQVIKQRYHEKGIELPADDWHRHPDFGGKPRADILKKGIVQALKKTG